MAQQIRLPIYSLAGGVGRQPITKRLPSEAQELDNVFLTIENSFEKRNGFDYFPGKAEEYVEDVDLAPNAMVFNTLDLTIGGSTGTEIYIPDDEDDFFFKWLTVDETNEFLIAINVGLTQSPPTTVEIKDKDGNTTIEEVQGSTQDYVWNSLSNSYDSGYSLNYKKKFITVWKIEEKNLSLQSVDYGSVTKDVIDYIREGYKTGEGNNLIKLKAFGTSAILLNKEVKAGYKELYKTDFDENPIIIKEYEHNDVNSNSAVIIEFIIQFDESGFFNGYEIDQKGDKSGYFQRTFKDFNEENPLFSKGDIIKIYESSSSSDNYYGSFLGQFVLLNHKSRFAKIKFTKDDIGKTEGIIPRVQNDGSRYRIKLVKTEKDFGGEEIKYRTSSFPRSLGFQAPEITETTRLIDLNGIDLNSRCSRFNPDGADFQTQAGCGWNYGELNHNYALGSVWYENGAVTTQVDFNITTGDQEATIKTLMDIVARSGGNAQLKINKDTNGLFICDRLSEDPVPIIQKYVDIGGEGCVKFDNTGTRLGLTSYGETNVNPLGVGQVSEIFQNKLEFVFSVAEKPLGDITPNFIGTNWYPGHAVNTSGYPSSINSTYRSFMNNPVVANGGNQYGNTINPSSVSFNTFPFPGGVGVPFYLTRGVNENAFVNLMFPFHSIVTQANSIDSNDDNFKTHNNAFTANGTITMESRFSGGSDEDFIGLDSEGTRFSGSWTFRYPSDKRVYGTQTDTGAVPDVTASLLWNIGELTITIDEPGEGYSNGRFTQEGIPPLAGSTKDIIIKFHDMPGFRFSQSDPRPIADNWKNGIERTTYEFIHRGTEKSNTLLFNPQTVLREMGLTSQKQINNIGIINNGITTDISEPILHEVDLTNSVNETINAGVDQQLTSGRYSCLTGSGKGAVLQPSDTLTTLNHFIRAATAPSSDDGTKLNLLNATHALTLDNDSNSVVLKQIKGSTGAILDIPKVPYITDVNFFTAASQDSLYLNKEMDLNFTEDLKIKYNRSKHQPIGDNIVLSTSTALDIGQSIQNFSLIPIPPTNDDDFTDLNGAEESLSFLYAEDTVGDADGRGKVFVTRESYLTKPSAFFRTVSFEDRGSPFYEQVRAESPYGSFDTRTMPLLFDFVTSENTWRFLKAPFKDRLTGTLSTNPGPSAFIGANNERVRKKINDVTFWRDRFWMCAEDNVFCSKVGDFFNLWIDDPDNIVDTDPVDVRTGRGDLVTISHLVPFESYMFVSTLNDIQFELLGSENQITPLTAELQATAFYSTDPVTQPQLLGSQVYFFAPQKIYLYYGSGSSNVANAAEVTFQAEGYLPKTFQDIATSAIKSLIALVDRENQNVLYFYTSRFSGDKIIQNSLHKWTTDTTDRIKSINFIDDVLYSVVLRPYKKPSGEESSQFFIQKTSVVTEDETYPRIDRRVSMSLFEDLLKVKEIESDWGKILTFTIKSNNTSGYQVGDTLTFENKVIPGSAGGNINTNPGSGLILQVTEVETIGKIKSVALQSGGSGYLLPSDLGIADDSVEGILTADSQLSNLYRKPTNTNVLTSASISGLPDVAPDPGSNPTINTSKNGTFAVRPESVNYKVPQGYRKGDVLEQNTTSGSGTGLSIRITKQEDKNIGDVYSVYGVPVQWEILKHGKGFEVGNRVDFKNLPGTTVAPNFKVKSIITNINFNTVYSSSSGNTTFTLPVHNSKLDKAIVGLNQTDIGEELTIVSSISNNGKKTQVTVSGDQRSSNVTSTEDYGQIEITASSFEDFGRNADRYIQEFLEYGLLFNFLDNEAKKTENWFGTSFTMRATLSELVFRDQTNNALDGVLNIKNVSMKFYKTGKFNFEVKRKQYNNNTDIVITDPFYKQRINSESFTSSHLGVQENGEFMAKVMSFAHNAEISFVSSYHEPVNIANIEFRGIFSPRMSSIRN